MGFLKMIWGNGRPPEPVSKDELDRILREYDRKLEELDTAIHALRDREPDERDRPHAP